MTAALALSLVTLLVFPAPDEDRVELAKLQGNWQITRVEEGGRVWPKEKLEQSQLIITASRFRLEDGKASLEGSLTIGKSEKHKAVDAVVEINPTEQAPAQGIYRLDGNTLEVCFVKGKNRPDEFKTGPDLPTYLFVAKRKVEEKPPH